MIHHCDVVLPARRVTVIDGVTQQIPNPRFAGTWYGFATAIGLLLSVAGSLGAQGAPAVAPKKGANAPAAAAAPVRNISWTSDRRSFAVGDIIKVVVDEYALAQATKDNNNSAGRSRSMTLGIDPPSTGGAGASAMGPINGSVQTGDAGQDRQQGRASRDTRYVGEIAVRVVAVSPEGLLQIKGTKLIDVDKNKATLTVAGFVRPIDIESNDMIRSDVIADAQISYSAKGGLGKPRNGIVSKIIGIVWP